MRKRNRDRRANTVAETVGYANLLIQWPAAEKSRDRHTADRYDHGRRNHFDLCIEPARAVRDLGRRRNTITAAARARPRKAARHCRDVDATSEDGLFDADVSEPPKHRSPCASGKRSSI